MIQERQRRLDGADGGNAGRRTTLDHDDLDAERPGRSDLRIGCAAAGVLGHHDIDAFALQQLSFVRLAERATRENVAAAGNGKRRVDRIDAADDIAVLGSGRKAAGFLSADGEKDTARRGAERHDRGIDISDARPPVAVDSVPGRSAKRKERNVRVLRGGHGVGGYPVREGMSRIHEQSDALLSQVINQALGAAEAADPGRQGQGPGIHGAAGKRNRRIDVAARRQPLRQRAGLGRAAENQDTVLAHG